MTNTPSDWYGVTVESGHVIIIAFNNNNLSGSIPPELGNLTNMTGLYLYRNKLSGNIPPELGSLINLTGLALFDNQLDGSIPPELGNLSNLTLLQLFTNHLSGSIPPELGKLTNLTSLLLFSNQLSGNIPSELGNLVHITSLHLDYNGLSGNIPPWLGNLTSLTSLNLGSNQLSGNIPTELGNLTNLMDLYLGFNQLDGSIPPELGNLINLNNLDLGVNQLSVTIPSELGNLTAIHYLYIWNNRNLTGPLPASLTNLILNTFYFSNTDLCEPNDQAFQTWLSSIPNLVRTGVVCVIGFSCNLVTEIPQTECEALAALYNNTHGSGWSINQNWMVNTTPSTWYRVSITSGYVLQLNLSNNQLSGSIPAELGNLTNLIQLLLDSNQLSGTIPAELGNLINLQLLWLQDNQLSGDIPSTFINLVNLDSLDLDYNFLTVPPGYPDPSNPFYNFLYQRDPHWHLYQGFTQMISTGGGELTSLDGRTDIVIPANALDGETTFTFIPLPAPTHDSGTLAFSHNSFLLTAVDGNGNPITAFNQPVTVTLTYTDTDIIGIPEATLGLYYWDEAASAWTDAVSTCPGGKYTRDPAGNLFALPLCHLTEFGVFGTPLRIFLPVISR